MFFPSSVGSPSDFLLALYCLPGPWILGELYTKYQYIIFIYDPLSQKMHITVPSTSNRWSSSQNFLRNCFLGYNPQFGLNKIPFFSP